MLRKDRFLFISDLQIPFEAHRALEFCVHLADFYEIPPENIYNVGDETDGYWGSLYKKSADATHTARSELEACQKTISEWGRAFPLMKIAISNHGMRWLKKAMDAEIPSQILRPYKEIIGAPEGWEWRDIWKIDAGKKLINLIHGMGYSGQNGHINAAIDHPDGCLVMGHLHSHAAINFIHTAGRKHWACNAGCLIDTEAYAFSYGKYDRKKPVLTTLLVMDGGNLPVLMPYEHFAV